MTEWIVTSSALILIVIALRGLLKGKISLKLQYMLWALVLVRLLLPFSIVDSAVSIVNILEEIRAQPMIQEVDDAVADYESAYQDAVQKYESSGTAVSDLDIRQEVQQELFDHTYEKIEQQYTQSGTVVTDLQIQTEAQRQVEVISLTAVVTETLPYLWIGGMIAVGAALIVSNLCFGWNLYKSRKPLDVPGVPLKVYLTDYVATPCLFGFLLPDIYLTREVMEDSKMRGHVLAHEMSHYRQGDHIWSALRCVCLTLHWYNPLVWAAAILSKQDAELSCDEATIRHLGENERVAYGRTLIGMTCVRRDPRSLMLTATTMLGTKRTLKERIALIAKKPKTALYTLISCVLVAAIAVGCTFTGAPTEPTEPTSPEDAVWEQLNEAVDAVNSAESCHVSAYLIPEHPDEVDLDGITPANEVWAYGEDFYVGNSEPFQLYYEGTYYSHISDNTWLVDRDPNDDEYGFDVSLPSRSAYTMTWTQAEEYLDVVLQSTNDENVSHLYRMDTDGKLLWYASTFLGAVTDADGVQTPAVLYTVYVLRDTAPADVQEKVETSAAEILANMVEWDGTPPTESAEAELVEKCRQALADLQTLEHVVLNEWKSTTDPDIMLAWVSAQFIRNGDDWVISKLMDPVTTFYYMEVDGVQYVRYLSEHPDTAYPNWTETDLSAPEHEFSDDCWIMEYQWDSEVIAYQGSSTRSGNEIITLNLITPGTNEITGILEFEFDSSGSLERVTNVQYTDGPEGQTYELTSEIEVNSTWDNYCAKLIEDYYYQTTAEYRYQELLNKDWIRRILGCVFENPEDISLEYLFYLGLPVEERTDSSEFSQAEIDFLRDKLKDTWWGEDNWVNANKFPADRLDEILNEYLGVSLDEVQIPERWYYFSETDSYYDVRTDAYAAGKITLTELEEADDDILRIRYEVQGELMNQITDEIMMDPEMLLTLRVLDDGSHQILSNVIDPDSTYYLLYTSGLARLFQTGSPQVYIYERYQSPSGRTIPVNEEIIHGLMEHLNHYNWRETQDTILFENDQCQEQIYFRNMGTYDQGITLFLNVASDGTYWLTYHDNAGTECYYIGTAKSGEYGTAAEDLRNFHETFWPETEE